MLVANSPLADVMTEVLNTPASVIIGSLAIDKSVLLCINAGLMVVFFLLVGLELKREVMEVQLSKKSQLILLLLVALVIL